MKTSSYDQHNRHSIRLTGYDYSRNGAYFITICAYRRECLFGDVLDGVMKLNGFGQTVVDCWNKIPKSFPNIELDQFMIMPNHIHGIIHIVGATLVVAQHETSDTAKRAGTRPAPTLGRIIGTFKSMVVCQCIHGVEQNEFPPFPGKIWQRNYYEHMIRNERSLTEIREYIMTNPARWDLDRENPKNYVTHIMP